MRPISYGMVRRILLLQTHRLEHVRKSATKIRDSYFFWNLLFCDGRSWTKRFLTDDAHTDDAHSDDIHGGLSATHVADDAHADDAKADDLDLDAEDPTDKDGDGNGTASMPVNGTQSKPVRQSPITAKDRAVHDRVSAS